MDSKNRGVDVDALLFSVCDNKAKNLFGCNIGIKLSITYKNKGKKTEKVFSIKLLVSLTRM